MPALMEEAPGGSRLNAPTQVSSVAFSPQYIYPGDPVTVTVNFIRAPRVTE